MKTEIHKIAFLLLGLALFACSIMRQEKVTFNLNAKNFYQRNLN
jgi:hypothetical protein